MPEALPRKRGIVCDWSLIHGPRPTQQLIVAKPSVDRVVNQSIVERNAALRASEIESGMRLPSNRHRPIQHASKPDRYSNRQQPSVGGGPNVRAAQNLTTRWQKDVQDTHHWVRRGPRDRIRSSENGSLGALNHQVDFGLRLNILHRRFDDRDCAEESARNGSNVGSLAKCCVYVSFDQVH